MSGAPGPGLISRSERIARAAIGMSADYPEEITRRPGRAEWNRLAALCAELWPNEEYIAIVAKALRKNHP
jgi:hypothetical protein